MSDKELLDHISKTVGEHACGRFAADQLNRKINITEKRRRFSWAYIWNLLLATFLVTESYAQGEPQIKKKPQVQLPVISPGAGTFAVKEKDTLPSREISGTILNEYAKEPIAGVTVMVKGTSQGVTSDNKGQFKLIVKKKDKVRLEVSAVGYKSQTVVLTNKQKWQSVRILLKEEAMGGFGMVTFDN
jgi:hypothetical protein